MHDVARTRRSPDRAGTAGGVVRVGAVLSLSGPFAAQGVQAARGLVLWAEDANGADGLAVADRGGRCSVALVLRDDAGRAATAAAEAERLLAEDAVDLFVGPYASGLVMAVAPVAERLGRVLWNHGGSSDAVAEAGFHFVVSVLSPASRYFVTVLEMVRALQPAATRIALLYGASGTFARSVIGGAEASARQHGFEVVFNAPYAAGPTGAASRVAEVVSHGPDVILGAGTTEADLEFARQLKARRVRARLIGLVAAPIQLFAEVLGPDAEGFVGPSQWEPSVRYRPDVGPSSAELVARFRRRFGTEADYPAAQAYAAGLVAQRCAELAGTLQDEPLRAAADRLALTTFYGDFRLDPGTGQQIGHQLVVVQWQGRAKPIVWPPDVTEASLQVPMPT
jgi:branched-chain amino acid transport system substrate-binding protein